jgi:hypothetical protein
MTRQFENPQPSLFDEDEPRVELANPSRAERAARLLLAADLRAAGAAAAPCAARRPRAADRAHQAAH